MKACVLERPTRVEERPLVCKDSPDPVPRARQVVVKVEACGVCHTDLHTVEGELALPRLPLIPGHQVVGRVIQTGPDAKRFRGEERVGIPWLAWACGRCDFCRQGRENLCAQAQFTGLHVDGGYAQFALVEEDFAHPLPESLSGTAAAPLLCGGIVGFRALRRARVAPGTRVALFGFGSSAHIALQVARYWQCEVFVFTRRPEHQVLAKELGAVWVGKPKDVPPARVQSAVIFAPAGPLLEDALSVLERGGTVALAGIYMTPIPDMEYARLYEERTVTSVSHMTRQDGSDFLKLAAEIPVKPEVEAFPLEEANEVLVRLKRSEIRGAAVLVVD